MGPDQSVARERILDAAEELFAGTGFDATPTAKIAGEAGIPKGLLFYYFPKKIDILTTLFAERMPAQPLCDADEVARPGDVAGSLRRLAARLDLGRHESVLLRTVLMREIDTHPEVRGHLRRLTDGLIRLTEAVLDAAAPTALNARRRRDAARTFVSVMLFDANHRRFDGGQPDLAPAARVVAASLTG